jgi:hypothetical protein
VVLPIRGMRVIELSTGGARPWYAATLDDRYLVVMTRDGLRVLDLAMAGAPAVLELPAEGLAVRGRGALLVQDGDGRLTRWQRTGERWHGERLPGRRRRGGVTVSPSGRYAVIAGDDRETLIDLATGKTTAELPPGRKPSRASFGALADGREVLFMARPGYMDVRVVDAATGRLLRAEDHSQTEGFCHVDFALGAGGTRLATFGCWWGAPYQAHLYDVSAWLAPGATPVAAPLPPPLLVVEPALDNCQLAIDVETGITAAIEDCASMTPSEHDDDPLSSLRDREPDLAAVFEARRSEAAQLLVVRAIDVERGVVTRTTVHPAERVDERHVHYAAGQRVVTFGARLLVSGVDGEQVDHGPVRLPEDARTAVTSDLSTAVIVGR